MIKEEDMKLYRKLYDHQLPENIQLSFLCKESYAEDKQLDVGNVIPVEIGDKVQLVNTEFIISRVIDVSKIAFDVKFSPVKPGVGVAANILSLMYGIFVDWVSSRVLTVGKFMLLKWASKVIALAERETGHFFMPNDQTVYAYHYDKSTDRLWVWEEFYEGDKVIKRKLIFWPGRKPSLPPTIPKPLTNVIRAREEFLKERSIERLMEEFDVDK